MAEIPHERDFLVWIILNFVQKSVRKHVTRLIDFASKLYDVEKFLILSFAIKNCLVLLRNFVNKPVE